MPIFCIFSCLRLPSLTADWLEHALIPVLGVLGSNPAVSGVISGELILAAGFIKSTLWQGPAQYFDFDSHLNSVREDHKKYYNHTRKCL